MRLVWIYFVVLLAVLWAAAIASAGTATVQFREPNEIDLQECRIFIRDAQHAVIANTVVAASTVNGGENRTAAIPLDFDLNLLEGKVGDVLARCVDVAGNVSLDSTPFEFTFPGVPPAPATVLGVQVQP